MKYKNFEELSQARYSGWGGHPVTQKISKTSLAEYWELLEHILVQDINQQNKLGVCFKLDRIKKRCNDKDQAKYRILAPAGYKAYSKGSIMVDEGEVTIHHKSKKLARITRNNIEFLTKDATSQKAVEKFCQLGIRDGSIYNSDVTLYSIIKTYYQDFHLHKVNALEEVENPTEEFSNTISKYKQFVENETSKNYVLKQFPAMAKIYERLEKEKK